MQALKDSPTTKFLGTFTLAMLSVSAIISLRNLPTTALLGTQSILFFVAAGICFFIPVALACAELASAWPHKGGVYLWVSEAFGQDQSFLAVWLQWIESVVWLPTILSFMAATLAYFFNPQLENNKLFLVITMLSILWGMTFLNFKGLKTSTWFSSFGIILGALIPGAVLILLGFSAVPKAIEEGLLSFQPSALFPARKSRHAVTFTAILLGLCGTGNSCLSCPKCKKPKKAIPKAIFLATALILALSIFGFCHRCR